MRHKGFCDCGRHQCSAACRSPATMCVYEWACAEEYRQLNGSFLRRQRRGVRLPSGTLDLLLQDTINRSLKSDVSRKHGSRITPKIEPTEVLSLPVIPIPFRLQPSSDEEELGPSYPLNFLPIASDMRGHRRSESWVSRTSAVSQRRTNRMSPTWSGRRSALAELTLPSPICPLAIARRWHHGN
jgi:hypothetical protein